MSVMGTKVLRKEDPALLTGGGRFVADLDEAHDPRLAGMLHVAFVRSTAAHADIVGIDTTEAASAPGVVGVFVHEDLDVVAPPAMGGALGEEVVRPFLADGRVRFVGEAVAAIVAETPAQAADAAELVWVDSEILEPLVDLDAALRGDVLLFPSHGSNVVSSFGEPAPDDLFDGCEVVVRGRFVNQRLAACPMETRGCVAVWEGGELTFWTSTQTAHGVRANLIEQLGIEREQVRVVAPDVGGGFGAKMHLYRDEAVVAWLARRLGRPMRWIESRSESMLVMHHGRGQVQEVAIGGSPDGDVTAYRLSVVQDTGAYPDVGAFLPYFTRMMAQGTYEIDRVSCETRSVLTTTTPTGAYRGAGRPEACAAIERSMDLFAAEIGMDPAELRRRNLVPADRFPYTTKTFATYDCGDYPAALDAVLAAAGYDELRADQARRREAGEHRLLGIGVSTYVEITAGPGAGEREFGRLTIESDGSATVRTGSSSHGQGHATSWSMIASDLTGIAVDRIRVIHGDTAEVDDGVGTFGSRSLQVGGAALHEATVALVDRARHAAAELLEAGPDDVVLDTDTGRFHVVGTPAVSVGWEQVASTTPGPFTESHEYLTESPTFPFGAHVAVVEVDVETGHVVLERLVAVDDAGRIVNPLIVAGQRHGGIAQGVAQALLEEVRFDEEGNPQTGNLADYGMISTMELPGPELVSMETPTPVNPLGAKGIGESGTIGATPAVQSAVVDALAHLGVRHIDMPCTSERVWQAISASAAGA